MAVPDSSNQTARQGPEIADLVSRVAYDPSARAFVEAVKAGLADGSIHEQLANQTDLGQLIEEHSR